MRFRKEPGSPEKFAQFAYVISLEGNDKDSGLGWKSYLKSLVFMPLPTVSTWAMEDKLIGCNAEGAFRADGVRIGEAFEPVLVDGVRKSAEDQSEGGAGASRVLREGEPGGEQAPARSTNGSRSKDRAPDDGSADPSSGGRRLSASASPTTMGAEGETAPVVVPTGKPASVSEKYFNLQNLKRAEEDTSNHAPVAGGVGRGPPPLPNEALDYMRAHSSQKGGKAAKIPSDDALPHTPCHYVLLKDDFSNLKERVLHFNHDDEDSAQAKAIMRNMHVFWGRFNNEKREKLLEAFVLQRYFEKIGFKGENAKNLVPADGAEVRDPDPEWWRGSSLSEGTRGAGAPAGVGGAGRGSTERKDASLLSSWNGRGNVVPAGAETVLSRSGPRSHDGQGGGFSSILSAKISPQGMVLTALHGPVWEKAVVLVLPVGLVVLLVRKLWLVLKSREEVKYVEVPQDDVGEGEKYEIPTSPDDMGFGRAAF